MNVPRYIIGSVAVFIYIFLIQWVFHSLIMKDWYEEAVYLLRPAADGNGYANWMMLGFLILAFGFCFIFIKGYENKGRGEGIRFGLYVGITFSVSTSLIDYAIYPIPGKWLIGWLIAYPIIMIIAGILIAAIYRPRTV